MKANVSVPITPVRFEYVTEDEEGESWGLVADPADVIADLMEAVQEQADKIAELEARLDAKH